MKSTEVYALMRKELGPLLKSLGFSRQKAFLSWARQTQTPCTVLWFQVSQDGWDQYAGSGFVVEFQRSESPEPGTRAFRRARMGGLLTDAQREEVWQLQNQVLSDLVRPPHSYPLLQAHPKVVKAYLKKFNPIGAPYSRNDDIRFRYAEPKHVHMWATLMHRLIPECICEIEKAQ